MRRRHFFSLLLCALLLACAMPAGGAQDETDDAPAVIPQPTKEVIVTDHTIDYTTIRDEDDQGIGTVQVYTLPLEEGDNPVMATYLPSGKVMVFFGSRNSYRAVVMNDDGTERRTVYRGPIPGTLRSLPFSDNARILLGDAVLECPEGETFDTCEALSADVVLLSYPKEFSAGKYVYQPWSECIISPDNEHIAWTILRTDIGAAAAMGRLMRGEDGYTIEDAGYICSMRGYALNEDGTLTRYPVIGGEVKQFVYGGSAISFVGADTNGTSNSVVTDLATGDTQQITRNPGYDETTIFSPDDTYGITMTTRFSETTDMAVLGLVPRPYGDAAMHITSQVYYYGVSGVRRGRDGNIGPALINIERSMNDPDYMGINLSDPSEEYIYYSPMSWNGDGTRAMWMEGKGKEMRVRIVILTETEPVEPTALAQLSDTWDWADQELSVSDVSGRIDGAVSGFVTIEKSSGYVKVTYENYSDDDELFYSGYESAEGSMTAESVYTAFLIVTDADGNAVGEMDVTVAFTSATAAVGLKLLTGETSGFARWYEKTSDTSMLQP